VTRLAADAIVAYDENGSLLTRMGDFRTEASAGLRFAETARFIMWDGEACKDTGYCYFANSDGDELLADRQLTSAELIDMLVSFDSHGKINFGYGFDYDVDNILMDMPKRLLAILGRYSKARWKIGNVVLRIEYIPRKIFSIRRYIRNARGAAIRYVCTGYFKIFDVVSYFNCRYDKALRTYAVGDQPVLDKIESGKEDREFFLYRNIRNIIDYCKLELKMGPLLMDKLRAAIHGSGYKTSQWYGPGAISKLMLKRNKFREVMSHDIPGAASEAARFAYAGGWFERFAIGYYDGPVWMPDINSAYPYAMSQMPSLQNGAWHHVQNPDPALAKKYRIGLYKIRYDVPRGDWKWAGQIYPLFRRQPNGSIIHAPRVENWYHAPEAATVIDDPSATFLEAWVFEDDGTYPCEWVNEVYQSRLALKAKNDPSELGIKLGLNAAYGTVAQQCGWDRDKKTAPSWHQLELAGYMTSLTRAMLYTAGKAKENSVVSFDTDGIIMTERPDVTEGNELGQWKVAEYSGIMMLQNGLYWLRNADGEWLPPKTRGLQRRRVPLDAATAKGILEGDGTVSLSKRMYVGFRAALHREWESRGSWIDMPLTINIHSSGNRRHYTIDPKLECSLCRDGVSLMEGLHPCRLFFDPRSDYASKEHYLEWLDDGEKERKFEEWLISIE
jgi:DNA polymerase type B, organellar and viral